MIRFARWLYLNSRYAAGLVMRHAGGRFLAWAGRGRRGALAGCVRSADRRIVEALIPGFESIEALGKFDLAIEALIKSRFVGLPIIRSGDWHARTFRRFEAKALLNRRYRFLICVPWQRIGGAERVAANIANALSDLYGPESVAVVVLDFSRSVVKRRYGEGAALRAWLPKEVPVIDLGGTRDVDHKLRLEILSNLFLAIAPEMIINVNSQTAWECYLRYGRQLGQHIRLAACLFSSDYMPDGAPAGYAVTYFRETVGCLDTVISDQQSFLDDLARRYGLVAHEKAKLRCMYQPAQPARRPVLKLPRYERLSTPPSYRRQVLWAGRITASKNPKLLIRLARENPTYDFHVYGARDGSQRLPRLRNLFVHGPFPNFDDIPHEAFDIFLYTSLWDGLPNVLLEAAERRLPIIAATVGGIGELVTAETGWPVAAPNDAAAFSESLRRVAFEFDQEGGAGRIEKMRCLIELRHSPEAFARSVACLIDGKPMACP